MGSLHIIMPQLTLGKTNGNAVFLFQKELGLPGLDDFCKFLFQRFDRMG